MRFNDFKGRRELAALPIRVRVARGPVRRHGAGQDAAVHRGGGRLPLGEGAGGSRRSPLARRLPAHAHRYTRRS